MVEAKNNSIDQINAQYGKLPPQAVDVEEAVLGALMLEADAYLSVSDIIDTNSFYKDENRKIFEAIKSLSLSKKPIDLLTVTQELKNRNQLDEVGGPFRITQLTSRVSSAVHIEFHARIIAQKYIQRELIRVSSEIQHESYDNETDIDDLISSARSKLSDIDDIVLCANSGQTSPVVAAEALKELEKDAIASKEGICPGINTGLTDLNRATGGWRNTNLIIIAARPGVGKSSFALNIAKTAAAEGKYVNFYGLEMKNHDLFRIMLSGETGISRTDMRDGTLKEQDWEKVNYGAATLEKLPILWNDHAGISVNQIRANTIRNNRAGRCDLVVIDYLQLVKPSDRKALREQQVAEISRTLKEIAMECNIPVICLAQLNRDVEKRTDKEPNLSDLRESGAIEQDADVILFLWETEKLNLKIGKNRRGKVGPIDFWSNKEKTVFADVDPDFFEKQFAGQYSIPTEAGFYEKSDDTPF
ncbi:MAG: replicative DNA helicase [Mangrovibacterium sp.]